MKKCFKKSLMFLLSVVMIFTMVTPIAFAEETVDVAVTFNIAAMENASASGGLLVTNVVNSASGREGVEGWHIAGGIITFKFSEEMDVTTLTPENIPITLGSASCIRSDNTKFNSETMEWTYEPYEVTPTTYSIAIADMCEGTQTHTVTFTSNVKTAASLPITQVSKVFRTGRIATTTGTAGKVLKNVAYGKEAVQYKADGTTANKSKWTSYATTYESGNRSFPGQNLWNRIDLGNYYNIEDVVIYSHYDAANTWIADRTVTIAYSNDPEERGTSATVWGTLAKNQYYYQSNGNIACSHGGRGASRKLDPDNTVRARYIFIKSAANDQYGEAIVNVQVLATVDTDYGAITATKGGETVTEFAGDGEYVVSVPVKEYVSGSSNGYMIVAGYDASGVITKINCAPVSKVDGVLSLATTFTDTTKSIKAVLIKDFTQPQVLTDALVLETPAVQE